jgi:magnesium transporter
MSETDVEAAPPENSLDEDDRLKPEYVSRVVELVAAGEAEAARDLVSHLHPADLADLFELVPAEVRHPLAAAVADLLDGDVLAEMNEWVREELIDALDPHEVAEIATQLDTDDAVSIIEELDADDRREVLRALAPDDRAAIEEALSYPEDSAGRLMQRDLIAVPEHWTVGDVLDYLRRNEDLTTDFWEIFVVDTGHHPIGTCKLSWILRTPRTVAIADVMQREQTLIPIDMDQEEVALRFQKYALISAAVIDQAGRLAGMITVDDVVHIIQEEAGEDILKLSGAGDGDINEPIGSTIRTRLTWLVVNLGTAILAASVVGLFQGTISRLVALAVLMPIVSGMGGNAGTQTMAVVVRALATNQLTSSNTVRMIVRELRIATANGLALGTLIGLGTWLVFGNTDLGVVIAMAMVINNLVAGLSGILIPVTLEKFDIDPAVASAVFVTTMTDVMGFFSFLGLATLWGLGHA